MNCSEVDPFNGMLAAPNALPITGGTTTVTVAVLLVKPGVSPRFDESAPVVLFSTPAAVPVTFTEKVQLAAGARVAPDILMEFELATAVIVPPPQLPESPFGAATARPAGRASVNDRLLSETGLPAGLVTVKLSEVEPFSGIEAAPNALLMVGGLAIFKV